MQLSLRGERYAYVPGGNLILERGRLVTDCEKAPIEANSKVAITVKVCILLAPSNGVFVLKNSDYGSLDDSREILRQPAWTLCSWRKPLVNLRSEG